jgi:hypothetical protein
MRMQVTDIGARIRLTRPGGWHGNVGFVYESNKADILVNFVDLSIPRRHKVLSHEYEIISYRTPVLGDLVVHNDVVLSGGAWIANDAIRVVERFVDSGYQMALRGYPFFAPGYVGNIVDYQVLHAPEAIETTKATEVTEGSRVRFVINHLGYFERGDTATVTVAFPEAVGVKLKDGRIIVVAYSAFKPAPIEAPPKSRFEIMSNLLLEDLC